MTQLNFDPSTARDSMRTLVKDIISKKAPQAAQAAAEVIVAAWKVLELPHNLTGRYQVSIQSRPDQSSLPAPGVSSYEVGTPAREARYLEYGTSREAAQPVLRPAYDESKGAAIEAAQSAFQK